MANYFTNILESAGNWFAKQVAGYINDPLDKRYSLLEDYYNGDHRRTLKTEVGKRDDNILLNYTGLAVDRSVSRLFAGGIEFNTPEGSDAQHEYLEKVWELNKRELLLYQAALYGAVFGTPSIKIVPDDIVDPFTKLAYPRLVVLFPRYVRVKATPHNMDIVERYEICYNYTITNPNDTVTVIEYKEIIRRADAGDTWVIEVWERTGGGQWRKEDEIAWDYDFPNVHHWKNLPSINNILGDSEIDDGIMTNDHLNFVMSNISKIIKFHAAPKGAIFGVSADQVSAVDSAVGNMLVIPNKDAKMQMVEMQSDLASSRNMAQDLQNAIFAQAREVDISTIADKLGALTNFGLKVLYTDAIQKNDTKRQLYGDAITEINRRLLVLAGYDGEASNPGEITWGNAMPINEMEDLNTDQIALKMGIVDRQTLAEKWQKRYGVDWETIEANKAQYEQDHPPVMQPTPFGNNANQKAEIDGK